MNRPDTPFPRRRRYSVRSRYGALIAAADIALDRHVVDRMM
jgi:hypothetical protein